ncbi:YkgJ family cysteine cluster protein [Halalkalibacter alkalisediminis]|uniref:YkgJ family cysteine cluster protein n=1 Tax=Halalkalibacter alkalisediminis TaxID=935616 RepID=A0ABV6N9K2_9BACI|nr:YkgJ family cysteine cluster protein [Halalkalibacter alkalisediminis]
MEKPLSYKELSSKVELINKRQYDYDLPFLDVVDQVLDESEGKHVKNVLAEAFEKLLSQVSTEVNKIEDEVSLKSSCTLGCAQCCFLPIVITRLEAKLMLMFINQMDKERKKQVLNQVSAYIDKYSSLLSDVKQIDFKKDDAYKIKYKQLGIPCVFLDQKTNSCMVYEIRPISCRTYVNYVDASVCSNEYLPKEPLNFEFMQRFYVQGMDEVIQEILEVVEGKSLGFSYPDDAAEVNYLPLLLQEELDALLNR